MGKETGKIEKTIERRIKKVKSTCKKICCCTFWWLFLGLAVFVIAIVLLVFYAKHWNDQGSSERVAAIIGVAFLFIGLFMFAVGVTCCVLLTRYYKKMSTPRESNMNRMFRPQPYAYGKAPYPQQPPLESDPQADSNASAPMIPTEPSAPGSDPSDVHVEVTPNERF